MTEDKITDEQYMMMIYLILRQEASHKASNLWQTFENQIRYKSRFFPKGELLLKVKQFEHQAELYIHGGEKFYRARVFKNHFLGYYQKEKEALVALVAKYYPEVKGKDIREIYAFLSMPNLSVTLNNELWNEIKEFFRKRKRFWGYNSKDSDAPPRDVAAAGRANSKYISFLYLATDIKTAISELRPHKDQDISVATVRIDKDLKIYDFCSTNVAEDNDDAYLLEMISELFSDTKDGSEYDYYATQYICEYIRELGFDGIRFKSSLNPEGMNIVLFDTNEDEVTKKKNYTIVNSKVFSITSVDVQYNQIAPLKVK